jgi:hypothetical protein
VIYEISRAIGSHILWFLLLGWTGFRFFRYSPFMVPRNPTVSKKDYGTWREWESSPVVLTLAVMVLSILFTLFYRPKTVEDSVLMGAVKTVIFLLVSATVIMLQSSSYKRAKRIGMFRKGPPPLPQVREGMRL